MARIDLRVRAWAWLTRRQASVATMTEEQVRAVQTRAMPDNAAGVPVRLTQYVGQPHGFLNFPGLCRGAEQALSELIAEQRTSLA